MRNKLIQLQGLLAQGLVGRENAIRVALLGLIAGENTLFIGPPGTAKSMIARRVSEAINPEGQHDYFEYLLTKFSTPEELFGPLSLTALKQDQFKRNTTGYLPTVKVAFLDEIFKASSSILNSLLTILNERKFHNGNASEIIPLQSLIAASNELPKGQPELAALYDRFLLRYFIDYLESSQRESLFDLEVLSPLLPENQLSLSDLTLIIRRAKQVTFPAEIQQVIQQIWKEHQEIFKENADEHLSDRRFVKVINLLRFSAATNERQHTDLSDVMLLKDCLWNDDANAGKVGEIVRGVLQRFDRIVTLETTYHEPILITPTVNQTPATNVLKGYRGSGTADDPFLIEGLDQLIGLQHPNIGQKGYYFKQTVEINCSQVTSWPKIIFCGHYNGNGQLIWTTEKYVQLFDKVKNSTFLDLEIKGLIFSELIEDSLVNHLKSDRTITWKAINSSLSMCTSRDYIAYSSDKCKIDYCTTGFTIVKRAAYHTKISNCLVKVEFSGKGINLNMSGIAQELNECEVNKCFIASNINLFSENSRSNSLLGTIGAVVAGPDGLSGLNFSGVSCAAKSRSVIQNCAIGKIGKNAQVYLTGRIVTQKEDDVTLKNNISLDFNKPDNLVNRLGADKEDGLDISPVVFNQYYLEDNLGWDFKSIWQWDDTLGHPVLRSQPIVNFVRISKSRDKASLLYYQLRKNIWLVK